MVPESSLQLQMLIYNGYESMNLQKKLRDNAMRVWSQILDKCATANRQPARRKLRTDTLQQAS
jgi:hypothetical protein